MKDNTVLSEVRHAMGMLPPPLVSTTIGPLEFKLYRARRPFAHAWEHEAFETLVIAARRSYRRWGNLEPLDDEDAKSAIYLAHVSYPAEDGSETVHEWLSYRFVPASGVPEGVKELMLFVSDAVPVLEVARKVLFLSSAHCEPFVVNSSRLCGVPPFLAHPGAPAPLPKKHRNTALAFALMNERFLEDCREMQLPFRYLFGIIQDDFIRKVLSVNNGPALFSPAFPLAEPVLGLPPGAIRLDREALSRYVFRFPFYFFENGAIVAFLVRMFAEGKLTNASFERYLLHGADAARFLNGEGDDPREPLEGLDKLLGVDGPIEGSPLTGDSLRSLFNEAVPDHPSLTLRITSLTERKKSVAEMIAAAERVPDSL